VVISYAREDSDAAKRLYNDLKRAGSARYFFRTFTFAFTFTFDLKDFNLCFYNSLPFGILALEGEHRAPNKSQENTVFISYTREDFEQAVRLYEDLKNAGLNVKPWLDKNTLQLGQNWENEIHSTISKCRYFIPLFSKTSVAKLGFVQKEWRFAWVNGLKRYPPNKIFFIPVRLDGIRYRLDRN